MNKFARFVLLLTLATTSSVFAANKPGPGYKLDDSTFVSPDKTFRVEQYAKVSKDETWHWQFWVFDTARKHGCLLNAKPMHDYAAGFRFSPDSQWLVRMQKTGAGYHTLYLYKRHDLDFTEATKEPLGDMAWDYYESVRKKLKLPAPDYHISADLMKGYDENYRWLGYDWPPARYIIISLSAANMEHSFACVYDTQSQKFSIPPDLESRRKKATGEN